VNLSEPFIRRPVTTVLVSLSAVLFGIYAYFSLPVSDMPDVDYPVFVVNAQFPGAEPSVMANNVATPLERQMMEIQGLAQLISNNTFGNTQIVLVFDLGRDSAGAAADIEGAISRAQPQLPPDLPTPPNYRKYNPNELPIFYAGLASTTLTESQLYDYAYTQVAQRLNILPGVANVVVYGSPRAVRIQVDPEKLWALGLDITTVADVVQKGTALTASGKLRGKQEAFLLLPETQLETAEDYGNLVVATQDGEVVRIRDIADAVDGIQQQYFNMDFWADEGLPAGATSEGFAAVVLGVSKADGANSVEVVSEVIGLLPLLRDLLPGSIEIVPIYNKATSIIASVDDVQTTLLVAFILVVLVIFLFLGRFRDTIIPSVALPLSFVFTLIAMSLFGFSLDNLSLLALTLAIGFLVDDAVVFLENAVRRMQQFGETAPVASVRGAKEISFTILSMTLSLAAVFIPLVFMPGLIGRVFREFSITIMVAILASGLISLTVTPMMCARMLAERSKENETRLEGAANRLEKRILGFYGRTLDWFLDRKPVSVAIWIACMAGTILLFRALPSEFMPIGDSGFIQGVFVTSSSTSPEEVQKLQGKVDDVLRDNPAVSRVVTVTGIPQYLSESQGMVIAFLRDLDEKYEAEGITRTRPPIEKVNAQLLAKMGDIPGVQALIRPQPVMNIGGSSGVSTNQGQYAYLLSGLDQDKLFAVSEKLVAAMKEQKGALFADVSSSLFLDLPQLNLAIDRDYASTLGISSGEFAKVLFDAYSQNYSYLIKDPNEQYQVIVEMNDASRASPEALQNLYFQPPPSAPTGGASAESSDLPDLVPFEAIASSSMTTGPLSISHYGGIPSVTIFFDPAPGVPLGNATNWLEKKASEIIPQDITHGLTGSAQEFAEVGKELVLLLFVAIFVMYVIMGILYESYIHPLTVLLSLPTATVGGLLTLWIFGATVSFYVFVGMFMLIGIVKKNGIMMVDFAIQRQEEGADARQAIHEASLNRFRPIMMTTVAAIMGAMPIALGLGADASSRIPLGLTVVGGLLLSQLLTLYVTPVTFLLMESVQVNVLDKSAFFSRRDVLADTEKSEPGRS
jgi:HAE1 family hydrophobic/amphiphilic exporter-1